MNPTETADVKLRLAQFPDDLHMVRSLFLDYQADLGIDLCFQGFETELAQLPGEYAQPAGSVFVAMVGGEPAGCCAFRPLTNTDHLDACEMKRLFVRRAFRGFGLGRLLVEQITTIDKMVLCNRLCRVTSARKKQEIEAAVKKQFAMQACTGREAQA